MVGGCIAPDFMPPNGRVDRQRRADFKKIGIEPNFYNLISPIALYDAESRHVAQRG